MRRKLEILALVLTLALAGAGCLVSGADGQDVSLQFSLGDLGLDAQALDGWLAYLDQGGFDVLGAYDMGLAPQAFYLGLTLTGVAPGGEVTFEGGDNATLEKNALGEDVLSFDLQVSDCTGCVFAATIFWREGVVAPVMGTFTGMTSPFVVPGPTEVPLDVYQAPTGRLLCNVTNTAHLQGDIQLAALDLAQNVIFPAQGVVSGGQDAQIILSDIPAGRTFAVVMKVGTEATYRTAPVATNLSLTAGQDLGVEIEITE